MVQCARHFTPGSECGFECDKPETNRGPFAFIVPEFQPSDPGVAESEDEMIKTLEVSTPML